MIFKQSIEDNQVNEINRTGEYIKILNCIGALRLHVFNQGQKILETDARANFEFEKIKFDKIVIKSEIKQKYEIWVSKTKLTFNPLQSSIVGSTDVISSGTPVYHGEITQILNKQEFRANLTLQADDDFYFGGEFISPQTAIEVKKGERINISTQGAVYGFAKSEVYKKVTQTKLNETSQKTQETTQGVAGQSLNKTCSLSGNLYVVSGGFLKVFNGGDLSLPPLTLQNNCKSGLFEWSDKLVFMALVDFKLSLIVIDTKTNNVLTQKEMPTTTRDIGGFHVNKEECVVAYDGKVEKFNLNDLDTPTVVADAVTGITQIEALALMNNGNVIAFSTDRTSISLIEPNGTQTLKTLPAERGTNQNAAFSITDSGILYHAVFMGSNYIMKSSDNGVSFQLIDAHSEKVHSLTTVGESLIFGLYGGRIYYQGDNSDVLLDLGAGTLIIEGLTVDNGFLYASVVGKVFKVQGDIVATGGLLIKTFEEVN